jgi:outer membrane receptor protein involved in Fe transport
MGMVASAPAVHGAQTVEERSDTGIVAQPLAAALKEFAARTGLQVVYGAELARGMSTNGAPAGLSVDGTLKALLQGTGLEFEFVAERTVAIREKGEKKTVEVSSDEMTRVVQAQSSDNHPSTEDSQNLKLEEILVTATKRQERIQDVPLSITAVTADEIDRRGLVSAEDYLRGIPGVSQISNSLGQSIVIRGIETSPGSLNNFFSGTTIATYFGETSTSNTAGLTGNSNVDVKLVDIERVEVLRGPQGTAFGNSALGGTVRTIPVAPKLDRLEGKASANYSASSGTGGDNHMIQAVANLPLVQDKFAIRAAAYQFEDSGFYRNRAGSDPDFQSAAAFFGASAFATNQDEVGSSNFTGGRIAALLQATDDLKLTLSYLTQKTEVDGYAITTAGGYEQALMQVAPQHVIRGQRHGVSDTDMDLANATMEYDLGWGNVLATFSHIGSGSTYALPFYLPVLPGLPLSESGSGEHREHSGEIRLTTQLDGSLNFLAGLYAEKLEDESDISYYEYGNPQPFGTDEFLGEILEQRDLKQKAAFAEITWKFLRNFTLTGGARAYDYERGAHADNSAFTGGVVTTTENDTDASGTSFRGNLSYKPTEDSLVYAGWSQGFRLGKAQTGLPAGLCDQLGDGIVDGTQITIAGTRVVNSDEVDNYEIGTKLAFLSRRLTLAADVYRIDWSGVPFTVSVPSSAPSSCAGLGYVANAGAARSEGVELEGTLHVADNLRVDFGGSSMRARLARDAPNLTPAAFEGDRLPGSPKINANLGLQYEFSIAGYPAFMRADSIYVGPFFGDLQESPETRAGDYVKVDATARVTVRKLIIELFVRNLTNVDEFTFHGSGGIIAGYQLRPRTVGLQLGYSF